MGLQAPGCSATTAQQGGFISGFVLSLTEQGLSLAPAGEALPAPQAVASRDAAQHAAVVIQAGAKQGLPQARPQGKLDPLGEEGGGQSKQAPAHSSR